METLATKKMTMGGMIRLQKALGEKMGVFEISDEDQVKMTAGERALHTASLMEVTNYILYVAMGSPADLEPLDIADVIPFDKTEEISNAIGKYMNQVQEVKKN